MFLIMGRKVRYIGIFGLNLHLCQIRVHQSKAMKQLPVFSYISFFLAFAACCPALEAQEVLTYKLDQRCIYSGRQLDDELYRFPQEEQATAWVKEIVALGDAEMNFELVQTNVENVTAVLDGERRYLLYSLDFLEKSTELEIFGALSHEIGHQANLHTFNAVRRQVEELEADQFMGYILSKKGFAPPAIDSFLEKMPSSYDLSVQERRQAVWTGFAKAERAMQVNSLPFEDDPKLEGLTLPAFPWPPPACNARFELPTTFLAGIKTLGEADVKVRMALDAKGYAQRSYFSVPNGFALVTQLEQYNVADGTIRNDRTRWLEYPAQDNFVGIMNYFKSLVMPQKGYFRLFVFVVTNQSFGGNAAHISKEQATAWLSQGFNKLPNRLAAVPFTADFGITALVYEFEVPESNRKPVQKCPSPRFDARTHLVKSGIGSGLGL